MPTPTGWSSTSSIYRSGNTLIDALLGTTRWANLTVTYSFPTHGAYWSTDSILGYGPSTSDELPWNSSFAPLSSSDKANFRVALSAWAGVANIRFTETSETSTNVGDIRAAYGYASDMVDAEASAYRPSNSPVAGDVWFNAFANIAYSAWMPGSYSYLTVLHELGHSLGLKHPFSGTPTMPDASDVISYTVMSYSAGAGVSEDWFSFNPTTPMILDIQAIQYIYGANYATRSGDDTYSFGDSFFHQTIWDGGGNDTIRYTGTIDAEIDLQPGHGSALGLPVYVQNAYGTNLYQVNNIWIAFGVEIENASGGGGADVINGNDRGNYLNGGMGSDTLYGWAGNDFFDWDVSLGGGTDTFYGGLGDDIFVLDTPNDIVIEQLNEGLDAIWVDFSYSISNVPNIEALFAFGNTGVTLVGNGLNNVFRSTVGNDTINGASGDDTVLYDGVSSAYQTSLTSTGWVVAGVGTGTDVLTSVEFVSFSDRDLSWSEATPPVALIFSPVDEGTGAAIGTHISVTFSEPIKRGTGSITLKTIAGTVVATYNAATSGNLSISGSTLTINPTADLAYGTGYKVEFAAGSIKDLVGNSYAGTTSYDFTTSGNPSDRTFIGTNAGESFISGSGNDSIDGGGGVDSALYSGPRANYIINKTIGSLIVIDTTSRDGTDTLQNVERITFTNGGIAFDTGATESGGETALLVGAVLPGLLALDSSKQALIGSVIGLFDAGFSMKVLSGAVLRLPIWDVLTGHSTPSNTDIASYLLTNVAGRAPDEATLTAAANALNTEPFQGDWLAGLALSSESQSHIGLAGLATSGLAFL